MLYFIGEQGFEQTNRFRNCFEIFSRVNSEWGIRHARLNFQISYFGR